MAPGMHTRLRRSNKSAPLLPGKAAMMGVGHTARYVLMHRSRPRAADQSCPSAKLPGATERNKHLSQSVPCAAENGPRLARPPVQAANPHLHTLTTQGPSSRHTPHPQLQASRAPTCNLADQKSRVCAQGQRTKRQSNPCRASHGQAGLHRPAPPASLVWTRPGPGPPPARCHAHRRDQIMCPAMCRILSSICSGGPGARPHVAWRSRQ